MQVNTKKGVVKLMYTRQGDRNPNVIVKGVELVDGTKFEATQYMNGKFENFTNPYNDIHNTDINKQVEILYGTTNGYPNPTFVGYNG